MNTKTKAEVEADDVRGMLERLLEERVFPDRPVIVRFEVSADTDYSGDPAFHITVLLDDATPEEDLAWDRIRPIEDLVFEKVFRGPDERWPYVRIIRESDRYLTIEE